MLIHLCRLAKTPQIRVNFIQKMNIDPTSIMNFKPNSGQNANNLAAKEVGVRRNNMQPANGVPQNLGTVYRERIINHQPVVAA